MSENLPKALPPMEKEIVMENLKGVVTSKVYNGNFKFRIPNIKMQAKAAQKRAQLNGMDEALLDPAIVLFHRKIAILATTIEDSPQWFRDCEFGYTLHDPNVVEWLYDQIIDFENEWYEQVWGKQGEQGSKP